MNSDTEREILTRKANVARSRLEGTLEQLDRKRHTVTDVPAKLRRHGAPIAAIAAGVAVALAGGGVIYRAVNRPRRRLGSERLRALKRIWDHPERVAQGGSMWREIGRKIFIGGVSFLAVQLVKRGAMFALSAAQQDRSPAHGA